MTDAPYAPHVRAASVSLAASNSTRETFRFSINSAKDSQECRLAKKSADRQNVTEHPGLCVIGAEQAQRYHVLK